MSYQNKYLKYKNKYLLIKKQFGATITNKQQVIIDNFTENSKINETHNENERSIISNAMEEKINNIDSIYTKNTSKKISNKMWGGMVRNGSSSTATSTASSAVASSAVASSAVASSPVASSPVASSPVASSPVASSHVASSHVASSPVVPIGISPAAASPLLNSPASTGTFAPEFITTEYRKYLFEMNKYQEILLHIFNGNDKLGNLADNNHGEIIRLINFIEKNYPTEDKYYFIICISFCFTDSPCDIIEYLISKLRLDRLIQIVYEINYGSLFNQIIYEATGFGRGLEVRKLDERKISVKRIIIFHKLLECYSEKPQQDFEELLMNLFSIQNYSFMSLELLTDLINFLIRKKFKLFEFLLENKSKLINFIRLLKENISSLFILPKRIEIIGTTEQQSNLFSNI